jgi:hypothetical protein
VYHGARNDMLNTSTLGIAAAARHMLAYGPVKLV